MHHLRPHGELLEAYEWHQVSARRQSNYLDGLRSGGLPGSACLIQTDFKANVRNPVGPSESAAEWHAANKLSLICFAAHTLAPAKCHVEKSVRFCTGAPARISVFEKRSPTPGRWPEQQSLVNICQVAQTLVIGDSTNNFSILNQQCSSSDIDNQLQVLSAQYQLFKMSKSSKDFELSKLVLETSIAANLQGGQHEAQSRVSLSRLLLGVPQAILAS